jgi:chaperonin GroEL (HSP60 family)
MPERVHEARVLVTNASLEPRATEFSAGIEVRTPLQLSGLINSENEQVNNMVKSVIKSGANAVFCQKGISDYAQELLARNNVLAVRRVREEDIKSLVKATGAKLVNDLRNVNSEELGYAGLISAEKIGDERLTIITGCKGEARTILARGSTKQVADEVEKKLKKGARIIKALKTSDCVAGAGATELMISRALINKTIKGKEQLSYQSFAKAMARLTELLIINSGGKALDVITSMKDDDGVSAEGLIINPIKEGVIEPLTIKEQVLISAVETANMILRIDSILKGK